MNLLFHWLTLNTRWKFVLCTIVVFGLAVAVEGLAFFRHVTVAKSKKQARQQQQQQQRSSLVLARYFIPVLHGLQAAAGYTLMLIAMTFSLELMCSVVMGLATGYAIFFVVFEGDDDPYQLRQHVTTNPCCEFMEEESRETTTIMSNSNQNARGGGGANNVSNGEDDLTLILAEGDADAGAPTNNTGTTTI